jgi:hypothetical protein
VLESRAGLRERLADLPDDVARLDFEVVGNNLQRGRVDRCTSRQKEKVTPADGARDERLRPTDRQRSDDDLLRYRLPPSRATDEN